MPPFQVSVTSEFDYMLYHALQALKEEGYETVLLSNNDESASMDYSLVDRVYFEPINLDSIITICEEEGITDVVTQFSGKQVSALRVPLMSHGLKILASMTFPSCFQSVTWILVRFPMLKECHI